MVAADEPRRRSGADAPGQVPGARRRRLAARGRGGSSPPGASASTARSSPTRRATSPMRARVERRRAAARRARAARHLRAAQAARRALDRARHARAPDRARALPRRRRALYPVGRLDADSSGLILLSNDGELANRLTHPRFEVAEDATARSSPAGRSRRAGAEAPARGRGARGRADGAGAGAPARRARARADDPRGTQPPGAADVRGRRASRARAASRALRSAALDGLKPASTGGSTAELERCTRSEECAVSPRRGRRSACPLARSL